MLYVSVASSMGAIRIMNHERQLGDGMKFWKQALTKQSKPTARKQMGVA
jgi:hypothetical protein